MIKKNLFTHYNLIDVLYCLKNKTNKINYAQSK